MLRESHVGICRQKPQHRLKLQKRGRIKTLPLFRLLKPRKVNWPLLGFTSLVFLLHRGSARWLIGRRLHVTTRCRASGAGAAGAGAGGGGGGGSSFLLHPAKVRVKAKRVIPDNKMILFPILSFTSFPVTHLWKTVLARYFLSHKSGPIARGFYGEAQPKGPRGM